MTDHRRIQRTLFRMQLDPEFGRRVLARDSAALAATELDGAELALLVDLDPAAVGADRERRRFGQVVGNAASEFELCVAAAALEGLDQALLEGFPSSAHFHLAIRRDRPLPLAFARHAAEVAERAPAGALLARAAALEGAMARARREPRARPAPGPGELVLAPRAALVALPDGTLEWAATVRAAREAGNSATPRPARALEHGELEWVLLVARPSGPHRLPDVAPERLSAAVSGLLRRCERPISADARARCARDLGAEITELERFALGLADEGVLLRG